MKKRYYIFECTGCGVTLRYRARPDQKFVRPRLARCGDKAVVMRRVRMPK